MLAIVGGSAVIGAVLLVLVAGAVVVALLVMLRVGRRRNDAIAERNLQLNTLNRFAQDQGMTVMNRQFPLGDLRLFDPRLRLASADSSRRLIAGRWQGRPVLVAALHRRDASHAAVWLNLIVTEAELPSVDTLIYRRELVRMLTGVTELSYPGGMLAVPPSRPTADAFGVLCADVEVGRMWRVGTLQRRVEELGDIIALEITGRYMAALWATLPATPAAVEVRLDALGAMVRRMPQIEADRET